MGYTHYWSQSKTGQRPLKPQTVMDIKLIVATYRGILCYEFDNPDTPPVVNATYIHLNGKGDDGHETFFFETYAKNFEWSKNERKIFRFCKTARKPYDLPVCQILIALKADLGGKISVSSDGINSDGSHDETWSRAADMMKTLGYRVGFVGGELIADKKKPIRVVKHTRRGRPVRAHRRKGMR